LAPKKSQQRRVGINRTGKTKNKKNKTKSKNNRKNNQTNHKVSGMRCGSRQESTPGPFTGTLQGSGVVTDDQVDVETGEVNDNSEDMTLESKVLGTEPSVTYERYHTRGKSLLRRSCETKPQRRHNWSRSEGIESQTS
jgi:hypothetical protein